MLRYSLIEEFVDADLERKVLAAIHQDRSLYWDLLDSLPSGAFATEHKIWEELSAAIHSDQTFSVPADWTPSEDPRGDAKRLADLYQRRLLAEIQEEFAQALHDFDQPAQSVASLLETRATQIQSAVRELSADRLLLARDLSDDVLRVAAERIKQRIATGKPVTGILTGLPSLDNILNGLNPGLYVMSGAPGAGKTTGCLQVGVNAARHGTPCLYVTYENSPQNLVLKTLCAEAEISPSEVERGYGDEEKLQAAGVSLDRALSKLAILEGTSKLTTAQIRARALQLIDHNKATGCLIVVDYMQRAAHSLGYEQIRHNVSAMAGELRDIATRLNSPVLAISSQNRVGGNYGNERDGKKKAGSSSLDSLKESGDLEYSADVVMFLTHDKDRDAVDPARPVTLTVSKNRFGGVDDVPLIFRPDIGVLREVEVR